jgi:hypothetical protein
VDYSGAETARLKEFEIPSTSHGPEVAINADPATDS